MRPNLMERPRWRGQPTGGNLETADLLVRAGADPNLANTYGVTPLTLACVNRSAAMVETLLRAGADPNLTQWTGETALMTCARTGHVEAVKSLLSAQGGRECEGDTARGAYGLDAGRCGEPSGSCTGR